MDKVRLHDESLARANDLYNRGEYEEAFKHCCEAVGLAEELGVTRDTSTAATLLDLIENQLRARTMQGTGDVRSLIEALGKPEWPQAIEALKGIGQSAVLPLCDLMNDPSAPVKQRGLAVAALGKIADSRALEAILHFLQDPALASDKYAMRNAIFALEHFHDQRIVEAVSQFLRYADEDVRVAAQVVLETHGVMRGGTPRAKPPSGGQVASVQRASWKFWKR